MVEIDVPGIVSHVFATEFEVAGTLGGEVAGTEKMQRG
jgi:hypothetical protein